VAKQIDPGYKTPLIAVWLSLAFVFLTTSPTFSQDLIDSQSPFNAFYQDDFGFVQDDLLTSDSIENRELEYPNRRQGEPSSAQKSTRGTSNTTPSLNAGFNSQHRSSSGLETNTPAVKNPQFAPQSSAQPPTQPRGSRPNSSTSSLDRSYPGQNSYAPINHNCHCHHCMQARSFHRPSPQALPPTLTITRPAYRYGDFGAKSYPLYYQQKGYNSNRTDWAW